MAAASENRSRLWILALVVWLAWLLGLVAMWLYYQWRAAHPHYLPLLSLLLIQFAAGLVLFAWASWRVMRGPRRAGALGWLLLGTAPLWFASAQFSYGAWSMYTQHAALTVPVKMASATVASLADMVSRYRHPRRSVGEHVTLFHDAADEAAAQLDLIDRHVEQMESLLGQSPQGKIHWIRGPVFNREGAAGWYLNGLAIVTMPTAGVGDVDRHEVAHAVIDRHCGPHAQPPLVLVEGWAESQSGYEPGFLAQRAWQHRQRGAWLSLRELTSDGWYACGDWPVYYFGGPLVAYLLDEFGGPKFLELYTTCRRETFAADCRRVLGVDLDQLDERYWRFVEERAERGNPLLHAPLADGVDREAWTRFARDYADAMSRHRASMRDGHFTLSFRIVRPGKYDRTDRHEIIRNGRRHYALSRRDDVEKVTIASVDRSFLLTRRSRTAPWTTAGWSSQRRKSGDYLANLHWIRFCQGDGVTQPFERDFLGRRNNDGFRVTRLAHDSTGTEATVRIEFEYGVQGDGPATTGWFNLFPDRAFAMNKYEIHRTDQGGEQTVSRGSFTYAAEDSTFPHEHHQHVESPRGSFQTTATIDRAGLEPPGRAIFQPETYGVSPAAIDIRYRAPWFVVWPAVAGVASLVVGMLLLVPRRAAV